MANKIRVPLHLSCTGASSRVSRGTWLAAGFTSVLYCLLFLSLPSQAQSQVDPHKLLQQMASALHQQAYQGNFVYMHGADMSTMRITHIVDQGEELERITHLDGKRAEVIRNGDQVVCIHPDQSITRLDRTLPSGPFSRHDRLANIPDQYQVLLDGPGRVADRDAIRIRLRPVDAHRYGYRLWLDRKTHLLLKSELVDQKGLVLEKVEFVSLKLAPEVGKGFFAIPDKTAPEKTLVELPAGASLLAHHFDTGWLPAGFVSTGNDLRQVTAARMPVEAYSFSDGLAAFTLFVEPVKGSSEGISRMGPTVALSRIMTQGQQTFLVTLVGEIPPPTAEKIISALVWKTAP